MTNISKNITVVVSVIIIILVVGGMLLWTKSEQSIAPSTMTDNEATVIDNRILLTPENISQYNSRQNPQCDEQFNNDPADTTVRFSSSEKGIAFDVPYNSNWGSAKFRIDPYWESDNQITFGDIGGFEACMWTRSDFVHLLPQRSTEEVISKILASNLPELIPVPPTTIELNGLTVVKYATTGLCSYPALQIIGEKYNYEFVPVCSGNIEKDFEYLEGIVKSAKLME